MKKLALLTGIILISTVLVSCGNKESEKDKVNDSNIVVEVDKSKDDEKINAEELKEAERKQEDAKEEEETKENVINADVQNYFNKNKEYILSSKNELIYRGYAESGFSFKNPKVNGEDLTITYEGQMIDGYGEDERGARLFKLEYNFKADEAGKPMAYERFRNSDYMAEDKDNLYSIIKNYIFMWGEIKNGSRWEQAVEFKGTKYKAKTEMSEVSDKEYKLTTTIKNIKGFEDNTYTEVRTYEKGKGLTSFTATPYLTDQVNSDILIGYTLNP